MDHTTTTVKPLTKEDTKTLLSFVEKSKIINNKTTNATTNKLKNEEWQRIADQFNAMVTTGRRTAQQLRLKWENLKKNSRKRSTLIRMNNIKTGGGAPDFIPADDILDRVAALLGSTVDGFTVRFGGDAEPEKCCVNGGGGGGGGGSSGDGFSGGGDHFENEQGVEGSFPAEINIFPSDEVEVLGELVVTENTQYVTTPKPKTFFTPRASGFKRKSMKLDENRAARNQAIAEYYITKKKYLEVKLENILLENKRLKSGTE